jgi:hypothetical protein
MGQASTTVGIIGTCALLYGLTPMYYGLFYLTAKAGVIRDVSSHTEVALFYLCRADGEE